MGGEAPLARRRRVLVQRPEPAELEPDHPDQLPTTVIIFKASRHGKEAVESQGKAEKKHDRCLTDSPTPSSITTPFTTSVYTTESIPASTVYDVDSSATTTVPAVSDSSPPLTMASTFPPSSHRP